MGIFSNADKIANGVIDIGKKGMEMWDQSKFNPQEQLAAFSNLMAITKSEATARSRRVLLWGLLAFISVAFSIGLYYVQTEQGLKLTALINLVNELKIGWGFVSAVSFYFLTHAFGKLKSK